MPQTTPERAALRNIAAVVEQSRVGIVTAADALDQIERIALQTLELPDVARLDGTVHQGRRIENLRAALERIANTDYRGNRPAESVIAFQALQADDAATTALNVRRGHIVSQGVADAEPRPSIDVTG